MPSVRKRQGVHFDTALTTSAREEMGIMLQQVTLLLLGGFIFRMVLPLHFAELYHTISGDSFFLIQDFYKVLHISQIWLERKSFNFHRFIGNP